LGKFESSLVLPFFLIQRVISLRIRILNLEQGEEESLGMVWNHFAFSTEDCPVQHVLDWMLLHHFWYGLWKDNAMRLNALFGGSFVHLDAAEGKEIVEYLRNFSPLCILADEVPVRG
jgi:hypothetical protein